LEFRQLRYFVSVVDSGSMSRAAEQLHIAQSALSKQISDLELELKISLLNRGRSGATVTDAGKIFYGYAQAIQKQIADARLAVLKDSHAVVGSVVLAIPQSVSAVLALPLMRAAQERLPQVRLHLNEELSGNLLELVRQGRVDLGLFTSNLSPTDFKFIPIVEEGFSLIHSAGYENAPPNGGISLSNAAAHTLLMPSPLHGQCTRVYVEQAITTAKLASMTLDNEINSVHILKAAVEVGQTATIMPRALALQEIGTGQLVAHTIDDGKVTRHIGIITSKVVPASKAKLAVIQLIADISRELCESGKWPDAKPLSNHQMLM
jgi:LysR family transcriptional regulator, nitrogen assimilation regulatory protein